MEIKINVTKEQLKAVEAIVLSGQAWIQAAWDGKANACMEKVINEYTNLQGGKLSKEEKNAKINELNPDKRLE